MAVRPELSDLANPLAVLDRPTRQALEQRAQALLSLGVRAELAMRLVSAVQLAALQTVGETLWAAEALKALYTPLDAPLPDLDTMDQRLRDQYLAAVEDLVALTHQETLHWLLERF
jgi:hypothetical protein